MNIIKFKDTPIDGDMIYMEIFRNKYCYAINFKYAVSFDSLKDYNVYEIESTGIIPDGVPFLILDQYQDVVDMDVTMIINDITKYIAYNNFAPDTEISLDELKLFRRWLATTLLNICGDTDLFDEKTKRMLEYYSQDLHDDTIDNLSMFGEIISPAVITSSSSCACTQNVSITGMTAGCDPIAIYRKGIYDFMVQTFGQIEFWAGLETEFLSEFKKYIDGIISYDLPLYESDYISDFADCSCVNTANTAQELLMNVLRNLSKSLGYIINNDMSGHKNFMKDSFLNWSSKLYEKMMWA